MIANKAPSGELEGAFLKTISDYHLLLPGDRVLLAFSGGPDSVFLAELFFQYRAALGVDFALGYVQHALRGDESLAEEAFVREYAGRHELRLFTETVDPRAEQAESKLGLEAAARKLRYAALYRMADEYPATSIATAHHLNDLMETLLYRLFKGTSPGKAAGIFPKRGSLIRPILGCRKERILEWLSERQLSYCEDATNSDTGYDRNYIRNKLIPPVLSRFTAAPEKIWDFCATAWEEEAEWNSRAFEVLESAVWTETGASIPLKRLVFLSDPLLTRVLVLLSKRIAGEDYHSSRRRWVHLRNRVRESGIHGSVLLEADRVLEWRMVYDHLTVSETRKIFPENEKYVKINTMVPGDFPAYGFALVPPVEGKRGIDGSGEQFLRAVLPGDRFRIAEDKHKKVQDELVDRKVPREMRSRVHVIVRSKGPDGLPNEEILAIIVPGVMIRVAYGAEEKNDQPAYRLQLVEDSIVASRADIRK